ncbi:MAG TPA: hypothetical protein VFL14_05605 [Xanthomonadales bacterium]|nr:hypothetical protein [Xanthomonadales bacterium]
MPREVMLALAFAPYAGLALWDGWLHGHDRRVPWREQCLHAAIAAAVAALVTAAFLQHRILFFAALAVLVPCALADELGWHAPLAKREKRVHAAAYSLLAMFVAVAWPR